MNDKLSQQMALINQNDKLLDDLYHSYASAAGLSDTELWIIYIAWIQKDGFTQKEICDSWSYSRQTVNTALTQLERRGYIRKLPLPGNRKSKQVLLTEAGRDFSRQVIPPLLDAEARAFAQLNLREREDFIDLMQKRTSFLQDEMAQAMDSLTVTARPKTSGTA